jgi:hypothetical protein
VNPQQPADQGQYDSPPLHVAGKGRLDSSGIAVMYGSQDIDICIRKCRVTAEDDLYVATLQPSRDLRKYVLDKCTNAALEAPNGNA